MSCYTRRTPKGLALAVARPPYVPIPVGAAKATAAARPSPAHCGAALRPIVRLFPARPMVGVAWPVAASAGALHPRRRKAHEAEDVHMHRFLGRSRPSALLLPLAWACSADACLRAGAAFMAVRKKKLLRFIDAPAISSVRSLILLEGARCPRRCGLGPTCDARRCSRGMVDGCIQGVNSVRGRVSAVCRAVRARPLRCARLQAVSRSRYVCATSQPDTFAVT
jgi:hypothetical protein